MAILKAERTELEMVKQAADRLAYRTNSKFVLNGKTLDLHDEDASEHKFQGRDDQTKAVNFG